MARRIALGCILARINTDKRFQLQCTSVTSVERFQLLYKIKKSSIPEIQNVMTSHGSYPRKESILQPNPQLGISARFHAHINDRELLNLNNHILTLCHLLNEIIIN